jgi:hypothetical protein
VPWNNEGIYLIAPWKWWRPTFLANDWTFGVRWWEHALYNAAAGLLSLIVPFTAFTWLLRLACWFAVYYALLRLARRLGLTPLLAAAAVLLWLANGQEAIVGGEWIIGGVEAKVPAYAALFLALEQLLDSHDRAGGILLGLTFSLHPAVGAGALLGVATALLFIRAPIRRWRVALTWFAPFALPGIVAASMMSHGIEPNTAATWALMARMRLPWHFDPLSFPLLDDARLLGFVCLLVAVIWLRQPAAEWRFLSGFVAGTGLLALVGLAARVVHAYWVMQVYPFRVFPLIVPLLLCFAVVAELTRRMDGRPSRFRLGVVVGAALALLLAHPMEVVNQEAELDRTPRLFLQQPLPVKAERHPAGSDWRAALRYLRDSTPPDAIVLASPWDKNFFFFSHRAAVVNFGAVRVDRMASWYSRLQDLSGPLSPSHPPDPHVAMRYFDSLSTETVLKLARRYNTTFLVTHGTYPFPLRFSANDTRVYALPSP